MLKNEAENIDRISHNIESLSKDMYEIKKTITQKENKNKRVLKKEEKA